MLLPIMAAVSTAAQVGSSVMSFAGQSQAADEQNLYNATVQTQQMQYRLEVMQWQNGGYQQDITFGGEVLAYQRDEFARQVEFVGKATDNIQKNYFAKVGQLITRQVEEDIAAAFGVEDVSRQARSERAKRQVIADARGAEGASVDQIINDVSRQQGEASHIVEMNRSAVQRQLMLNAMGLKAEADGAVYGLTMRTYAPTAELKAPAPPAPVTPAAPVARPNLGALAFNVAGSVADGFMRYKSWSGDGVAGARAVGQSISPRLAGAFRIA